MWRLNRVGNGVNGTVVVMVEVRGRTRGVIGGCGKWVFGLVVNGEEGKSIFFQNGYMFNKYKKKEKLVLNLTGIKFFITGFYT